MSISRRTSLISSPIARISQNPTQAHQSSQFNKDFHGVVNDCKVMPRAYYKFKTIKFKTDQNLQNTSI